MKISFHSICIALLMISPVVYAQNVSADTKAVEKLFMEYYPEAQIGSVKRSPVDNIYEIQVISPEKDIIYVNKDVSVLIIGEMIDTKTKKSLTEESRVELTRIDPAQLPLKNALKEVRGKGERQLIVFSDPDCPFCKMLEKNIVSLDNVTIYTFLYPLKALHPQAETKARQIWCSKDPIRNWHALMLTNQQPKGNDQCKNPIAENVELGQGLGLNGTPTIIFSSGNVVPGALDVKEIEKRL